MNKSEFPGTGWDIGGKGVRRVLIISPHFPPSSLAGVHRARLLAKHLPAVGWQPTIICIDEACLEERIDPLLEATVPSGTEIIKARAISSSITRLFGVGDIGLRGWFSIRRQIKYLTSKRRYHAALITGAPFYPMLLAGFLRERGVPVVLDFQDPWVSEWGANQPLFTKAGLSHQLGRLLEPIALRSASYVTSVSHRQNIDMVQRYPWIDRTHMSDIAIGGDPDDFEFLWNVNSTAPSQYLQPGFINFSFVGTYAERFEPVLRTLFSAVHLLSKNDPDLASKIRLNFVGTNARPDCHYPTRVIDLARNAEISHMVREYPARIPYFDALSVMSSSDGLLLIGSDEPHYTASRIYPALMSGRPYISIYHKDSSGHALLVNAGGGFAHAFSDGMSEEVLVYNLADSLKRLATAPESVGCVDATVYEPYEARASAMKFANIFDNCK